MKICIIIPSYNLITQLKKCLTSLAQTRRQSIDVMIVDNGSVPRLEKLLRTYMIKPLHVHFLRLPKRVGFSVAVNKGLLFALRRIKNIDYFLLLNNDAYVKKHFFEKSFKELKKNKPDLMSPGVLLTKKRGVDSMGIDYHTDGVGINRVEMKKNQTLLPASCLFISNAFVKDCFNKFGWLFIPIFDSYIEDIELSLRAVLMKKKLTLLPDKLVEHERSATLNPNRIAFLSMRNQLWTVLTTWTYPMIKKHFIELLRGQAINNIIYLLKVKYLQILNIYLQTLLQLPLLFKIRRTIQNNFILKYPKNTLIKNQKTFRYHFINSRTYLRLRNFLNNLKRGSRYE